VRQLFAIGLMALTPLLGAAYALSGSSGEAVSSGIRPVHAIHRENEVECEACHPEVETATKLEGLLPTMETCADCHEVEDEEECSTCHLQPPPSAAEGFTWPQRTILAQFPHQTHVEGQELACTDCHAPDGAGGMTFPQHSTCRQCHATQSGFEDCRMCHQQGQDLRPRSHDPQFRATHALAATFDQRQCESCHTQADCQQCHRGDNVRPRVHELNFVSSHSLEARSNERLCSTCHEDAGFCADCHRAEKILPQSHSAADWIPSRHGVEASFNIETCIACHDQGDNDPVCAQCHGR